VDKLYPILDTVTVERRGFSLRTAAEVFAQAGILQIRHKAHWSREFFRGAEAIAAICARAGAQLIVNDRADFALLLNAGLHIGQDDLPPVDARGLIGPNRTLGFSTHNVEQLVAGEREPVDYLAIGPIFSTLSKERPDPCVGLDGLRSLTSSRPLVAIGGITRANALAVLEAGANSVAVIGDLLPEDCSKIALGRRFEEWMKLVDR
jgi:thiamine-phosphate pyrophosphorylase